MDTSIPQNLVQCALDFDTPNDQAIPHSIPRNILQISAIHKKCTKCGGIFNATKEFFNVNKKSKDGLATVCKNCRHAARIQFKEQYKTHGYVSREVKRCSKCKESFPATKEFFNAHNQRPDGLSPSCKTCYKAVRALPEDWESPTLSSQMCPRCKETLPASEFHKNRRRGLQTYCKKCQVEHNNSYRTDSGLPRKWYLTSTYGITEEEYEQMFQMQGGVCALCKQPETAYDRRVGKVRCLAVDHDHDTGKVRALLCKSCNQALGLAKENPEVLRRMADYIEEHKNRNSPDLGKI